jgi:hypothetical protein
VGLITAESERKLSQSLPRAFAGVIGFSLLDEITQPLCGRHLDAFDFVADAVGSAAGLALAAGCCAAVSIVHRSAVSGLRIGSGDYSQPETTQANDALRIR